MSAGVRSLEGVHASLPSACYYEEGHYRTELERIWYRSWLCAGRAEEIPEAGDFRVLEIGNQSVVLTRDEARRVRAFHNTCRHRGSLLCEASRGKFRQGRIVCPYHAWTYSLSGELTATPWRVENGAFDASHFSLYEVAAGEWEGFLFVNLDPEAEPFDRRCLGGIPSRFASWRLGETRVGRTLEVDLACNWKVFWENFSECYHCPGVHPELCRIVPVFGKGYSTHEAVAAPGAPVAPLAEGAVTWSVGGKSDLPWFDGLSEEERRAGQTYGVVPPGAFFVAHVDYARLVQVLPLAPERTRLVVSWMFPPRTLSRPDFDLDRATELGELVVREDGRACELNQRGLRSLRHEAGVLIGQETGVRDFHDWVRERLADTG